MNTEVNGPANIITILSILLESGEITIETYSQLQKQAGMTMDYIKKLHNPDNVAWSDIIARWSK